MHKKAVRGIGVLNVLLLLLVGIVLFDSLYCYVTLLYVSTAYLYLGPAHPLTVSKYSASFYRFHQTCTVEQ
jgi:hypothetical protein